MTKPYNAVLMAINQTILEALIFVLLACVVGFAVNARRADGLDVKRDYFTRAGQVPEPSKSAPQTADGASRQQVAVPGELQHSFQTVTLEEAYDYYLQGDSSIVFIDARSDETFTCHIPGAVQFDYYHPERHLDRVLAATAGTTVIIIYCNGGECEDSIYAAQYLTGQIDTPLDYDQVYIFEGGIQAWAKADFPREPEDCLP